MICKTSASTGRLRFAAALLLGTMFATAAHAETLTVIDIELPGASLYNLAIPSVEVTDGNLTEAEIRDLFAIDSVADLSKWAGITAKSLKIPEITMQYSVPAAVPGGTPTDETITYRDIELLDVVDGVATSTLIGGADVTGAQAMKMTFGKMSSGRFDIGALLAFYGIGGPAVTPANEMTEVYADFAFEGGTFSVGAGPTPMLTCDFGAATAGRFLARPLKTSLVDLEAAVMRVQEAQKTDPTAMPAPADIKMLIGYYTDLLTAFTSDPMQFEGFDCSGSDVMTGTGYKVASGTIGVGNFEPGIYPNISLDDFNVEADGGSVGVGNFTWKRMDLNGPIAVLKGAAEFNEAWFIANWRKLVPAMDGLSFSDVTFDIPSPDSPSQRVAGEAGLFDITLGKYINGLPSEIALALDDATFPLPPELNAGPAAAQIAARGITEITSDTRLKLHWDEATNTIVVDELLSDADQFFRIAVTGTIGNATPALFGDDETAAMQAGMGLTVKDLTVEIEDRGFYGMVLAISSAEGGQPMQATRTALSGMVQGMTLAILGSDETALSAVGQLGKFLSGANSKVSITLTAKDGVGFSLDDLAALEKDPTVLAGKVTVTAVASGDPVPQVEVPATPAPDAAPAAPADSSQSLEDQKRDLKAPPRQ
jgi:hypothetical protein